MQQTSWPCLEHTQVPHRGKGTGMHGNETEAGRQMVSRGSTSTRLERVSSSYRMGTKEELSMRQDGTGGGNSYSGESGGVRVEHRIESRGAEEQKISGGSRRRRHKEIKCEVRREGDREREEGRRGRERERTGGGRERERGGEEGGRERE
eukprot:607768-Hanusia_phi.AAC.2